jgi:Cu-processing system permease protein
MTAAKVLKFQLRDLLRSRWLLGYALLLLGLTEALLRFGGGGPRAIVSLLNLVLILVPLVSMVFGTMYLYGAREFIELLLAQPVGRRALFAGLYAGLALPLAGGFLLGVGLPFLMAGQDLESGRGPIGLLLATGTLLTLVFTALAFLVSVLVVDRARGLGLAIVLWLGLTVLYDAVLVLVVTTLGDYPLELPLLGLTLLNPVDLGRILLLLRLDAAALMGYTGAVFERFFGSALGAGVTVGALALWVAAPLFLGLRRFVTKDF